MAITSKTIPPFVQHGAPPPPIIVPLDETDIYFDSHGTLLAFDDLLPIPFTKQSRYHPYTRRGAKHPAASKRDITDPPRSTTPPQDDPNRAVSSPLSSPPSSPPPSPPPAQNKFRHVTFVPQAVSTKIKVPRPKGAGRKNIIQQVNWEMAFLNSVKGSARILVMKHLNTSSCFKDQDEEKLNLVKSEMVAKYPRLDEYENSWPLDIIIMGLLKYSSSHGKDVSNKKVVDALRETVTTSAPAVTRPRRPEVID